MSTYDLGDPVSLTLSVRDPQTGLPLTPAAVMLLVREPNGVDQTFTPSATAPGDYAQLVLTPTAGTYRYRWATSGAGAGTEGGTFDVVDTVALVDVATFREQLQGRAIGSTDAALRLYLRAAQEVVESYTGPVALMQPVPAALRQAAAIIAENLWDNWRGAPSLPLQDEQDAETAVSFGRGFAVPNAAKELIDSYLRVRSGGPVGGGSLFAFPPATTALW